MRVLVNHNAHVHENLLADSSKLHCTAAMNSALKTTEPQLTPQAYLSEMASPQEIEVLVSQPDFELALSELVPSVSEAEMAHYEYVQVHAHCIQTDRDCTYDTCLLSNASVVIRLMLTMAGKFTAMAI